MKTEGKFGGSQAQKPVMIKTIRPKSVLKWNHVIQISHTLVSNNVTLSHI